MAQYNNKKPPLKTTKPPVKVTLPQKMLAPKFLKNLFIFSAFFVFFTLAFFLVWKRLSEEPHQPVSQNVIAQLTHVTEKSPEKAPKETSAALPPEALQPLLDRLDALEAKVSQLDAFTISTHLIAVDLIQGVLHNVISVDAFKTFLKKTPEPWAAALLPTIAPLEDIKSYPELENLLVLPISSKARSVWNRFKEDVKSLVSIRKIDQKESSAFGTLEDVQKAVHSHNIQKALDCFGKLPRHEQLALSSWQQMAQDRLLLETLYKNILLEMAKE